MAIAFNYHLDVVNDLNQFSVENTYERRYYNKELVQNWRNYDDSSILAFYGQRVGRHLEFMVHGRILNCQNGLVVKNTYEMMCCNANLVQNC